MTRSVTGHTAVARRAEHLRAELDRIRKVLAADPSVKRVLVFGSLATGQVHEWSDLDLVVIQETSLPFVERSARLARLLRPGVGVEFLVYTPEEFSEMARRPFVAVEVLQKGMHLMGRGRG